MCIVVVLIDYVFGSIYVSSQTEMSIIYIYMMLFVFLIVIIAAHETDC